MITAVDEWDRILNYTSNNSSGLLTLTSLVTMVNIIQENLVFDDIVSSRYRPVLAQLIKTKLTLH